MRKMIIALAADDGCQPVAATTEQDVGFGAGGGALGRRPDWRWQGGAMSAEPSVQLPACCRATCAWLLPLPRQQRTSSTTARC